MCVYAAPVCICQHVYADDLLLIKPISSDNDCSLLQEEDLDVVLNFPAGETIDQHKKRAENYSTPAKSYITAPRIPRHLSDTE